MENIRRLIELCQFFGIIVNLMIAVSDLVGFSSITTILNVVQNVDQKILNVLVFVGKKFKRRVNRVCRICLVL